MKSSLLITGIVLLIFTGNLYGQIIIDHTCTDITALPQSAIEQAKSTLHIVYGHTSHGSQLTTGMNGLTGFANGGGLGLSLPENIFAWNNGGTDGALDLHDGGMSGDVGYYPAWYDNTIAYLDSHNDVNVIMWSWCGQVDSKYASGTLYSEFLGPMGQLEEAYPGVTFVYMTGHVDHWDDANNKAANDSIRNYCLHNNKVLYDFADIESYDPDGNYYEFPHDNCDYYSSEEDYSADGNWATEWQNSHTEGVDWYSCSSAHSEALNANRKAYAAWWMFCRIAGWEGATTSVPSVEKPDNIITCYPNPTSAYVTVKLPENTDNGTMNIYNTAGNLVKTIVLTEQLQCIDVEALQTGTYIVYLSDKNQQFTGKFCKTE